MVKLACPKHPRYKAIRPPVASKSKTGKKKGPCYCCALLYKVRYTFEGSSLKVLP